MEVRGVVVVTGASAGIGRATARAFARRGWRVALLARGTDGLEGARRDVVDAGGEALMMPIDVARADEVEAAAERVVREWGQIDVWVNNAMATIFCPFSATKPDDFQRATEVTYLGAVWGTLASLKKMSARNEGVIVQVGSALAYRSIPLQAAYCGAKSALRGFTDSLRSELIYDKSRVHVTMVHLSAFNTPQFDWSRNCMGKASRPLGKIFHPELAAEAIFWATQHRRREVWVGWPAVQAILGNRVIPGILDHILAYQAYDGQQTDEALPGGYLDNLYQPVAGDHGARGRFSDKAVSMSWQFWLNTHRWAMAVASITVLVMLGVTLATL